MAGSSCRSRSGCRAAHPPPAAADRRDRDTSHSCATTIAGAIDSEPPVMHPTMSRIPAARAACASSSAEVRPPALVELDVDEIVAIDQPRQIGDRAGRLVGAHRHGQMQVRAAASSSLAAIGCSSRSTRARRVAGASSLQRRHAPRLVGIDDEARVRRATPHGLRRLPAAPSRRHLYLHPRYRASSRARCSYASS